MERALKKSSRRSFVVQAMSSAAGAWVGISTGGLLAWLSGCASGNTPAPDPPPPSTVSDPIAPVPGPAPEPMPIATDPGPPDPEPVPEADAGYEPPAPVVKYGGPPPDPIQPPINQPVPMYGGPPTLPPATKYGGMNRPKYGGVREGPR